jgi:threonine aldolase
MREAFRVIAPGDAFIFGVADTGKTAAQIRDAMKKEGVLMNTVSPTQIRLLTHLDVSREDVDTALKAFQKVLG